MGWAKPSPLHKDLVNLNKMIADTTVRINCKCGHENSKRIQLEFIEGNEIFKVGCSNCKLLWGEATLDAKQQQLVWKAYDL